MRTATTLGAFALGLAAVFTASLGVGHAVGPVGPVGPVGAVAAAQEQGGHGGGGREGAAHGGAEPDGDQAGGADVVPQGLSASLEGFTLRLDTPVLPAGTPTELALHVLGPDGRPVTAYTPTHDRDLHLILVRRDGSGYQHLHPERDPAGRWSVPVTLPTAGSYKVFADTAPAGRSEALTLAADLQAPGDFRPVPLPPVSRTVQVAGSAGYEVTLSGDLVAGRPSAVTLRVSRDGTPVTDLEPYLGAYGHLVSLRAGDLAYLHTHPDGAPGDGRTPAGPDVAFEVDVPTAGTYRLHLDFKHAGVVRTAEFTATAGGTP